MPDTLGSGTFGPWTIERIRAEGPAHRARRGRRRYTALYRRTRTTAHGRHGEIVMEDSDRELSQHLQVWMRARGRVLITGLGLGCVVRGLAANEAVESIDVIEIDRDIIERVGPEFEPDPRMTIIEGDARTHGIKGAKWDYAWHDLVDR